MGLKSFRNISKVGTLTEFAHYSNYSNDDDGADDLHDEYIDRHEWFIFTIKLVFGLTW